MIDFIFKRPDTGTYYRKWQEAENEKPRVKSLKTKNKEIATRLHLKLKDEKEREHAGQTPARVKTALQLPLSKHLATYLYEKEKEWKSQKHWQNTQYRISKVCKEAGWIYVRDISASSFRQWRAEQLTGAKTLNDYLCMCRRFLDWLKECGYLKTNPLSNVSNLKRAGKSFRRIVMTPEEFQGFINGLESENKRLCYLTAFYTGLRRSELEALEWGDLVLSERAPHIAARAVTTKNSKDANQYLPASLTKALQAFKPENAGQTDKVFDVPTIEVWKGDLKRAGIPYKDERGNRRDFHSLRVMCSTYMSTSGTAPRVAQEVMRHSDIKLTMGNYTDPRMLQKQEAVNNLPDFLTVHKNVYTGTLTAGKEGSEESGKVQSTNPQKPNKNGHKKAPESNKVHRGRMVLGVGFEPRKQSVHYWL
ncbi:tyrosine-type recombinase/integrase [Pontiellaceae bacterium B12219]|nr:tyrosine-type recombinase/integrase [Pontiellaceae bacterium B12219]